LRRKIIKSIIFKNQKPPFDKLRAVFGIPPSFCKRGGHPLLSKKGGGNPHFLKENGDKPARKG